MPLDLSTFDCNLFTETSKNYPNFALCTFCKNTHKNYLIKFQYESIVKNEPNPNSLNDFCKKFLMENVALAKVEMATKSLTKSIKDKRFNFVSQVSSLGMQIIFEIHV